MVWTVQTWLFYYLEVGTAQVDHHLTEFSLEVEVQAEGVAAQSIAFLVGV